VPVDDPHLPNNVHDHVLAIEVLWSEPEELSLAQAANRTEGYDNLVPVWESQAHCVDLGTGPGHHFL
jgi:hypothetical protein